MCLRVEIEGSGAEEEPNAGDKGKSLEGTLRPMSSDELKSSSEPFKSPKLTGAPSTCNTTPRQTRIMKNDLISRFFTDGSIIEARAAT